MLFTPMVEVSLRVAATSSRLAKINLIAGFLKQLSVPEVEIAVSYLSGSTRQNRLGIGYAALSSAAAEPAVSPSLEIAEVDRALAALAQLKGGGSAAKRQEQIQQLFSRATAGEREFLINLILGNLRQGALEGLMVEALANAFQTPVTKVRRAAMMAGDIPAVARALAETGESALDQYDVQLFRPVHPMLAQPAADISEALGLLGTMALEYKLDGARIQVHRHDDEIRVYTRALNEVTEAVPEVIEATLALPARELILDGEVISFTSGGQPQPFQVTMRRFGRRLDVNVLRESIPLTPVWFDILYRDGESLMDKPQQHRFAILRGLAPQANLVTHAITSGAGEAEAFLRSSLEAGHEGILVKDPRSTYAAGARGQAWLKIKKAHTLDLVILAAEWGSGRRKGWLSNLHLGARDDVNGGFAMLGKTFKGLTDEMLRWQTEHLLSLETSRDSYTVYVAPELVVEIAYSDLQVSPRYKSGIALRFARVKRYRQDKTPADADSLETVRSLLMSQYSAATD